MNEDHPSPIAIFDSGVGGLTVFREIARRLPREPLIYLGDSARLPYGTKSSATIERYALQAANFLLARGIKMLVVACNTATAFALDRLERELTIPVVGVIDAGARAAVAETGGRVGVIATEGTVSSGAYGKAIRRLDDSIEVFEAACPLFVPLVEEGWANTHVAMQVAETYLEPLLDAGIDTLVLGCTHYPILRPTLQRVAGPSVRIVDSAESTGCGVAAEVERLGLRTDGSAPDRIFLVTDAAERFRRIAGEFLEEPVEALEVVAL